MEHESSSASHERQIIINLATSESTLKWVVASVIGLIVGLIPTFLNWSETQRARELSLASKRAELMSSTARDLSKAAYLKGFEITYQMRAFKMAVADSATSALSVRSSVALGQRLNQMSWAAKHVYENRFAAAYPLEYQRALRSEEFSSELTSTLTMVQLYFHTPEVDSCVVGLISAMQGPSMIQMLTKNGSDPLLSEIDENEGMLLWKVKVDSIGVALLTAMAPMAVSADSSSGMGRWLSFAGLICDLLGAIVLAWGLIISEKEALKLGITRWAGKTDKENLTLPQVQDRLRQSKNAKVGLVFLGCGFILQILALWLQ